VKRLVAVLLGTVAGLLLAEGAVRLLESRLLGLSHPAVRFDPELGWVHRAGVTAVRKNEAGDEVVLAGSRLGIREPPRPYVFEGRESVLLLGDSFTAGTQVRFEDTWGAQLEERLRRRRPSVQVVNAGVDRYDLSQEYRLAERLWGTVRPRHLVVAVYLGNDLIDYDRAAQARPAWHPGGPFVWLREHSFLQHFVSGAWAKSRRRREGGEEPSPSVVEGWTPRSVPGFADLRPDQQARIRGQFASGDVLPVLRGGDEAERRLASTEMALTAFAGLATRHRVGMTLVLLPMKQEVVPEQLAEWRALHGLSEEDVERPHRRLEAWATAHDVTVADVAPHLRAHAHPAGLFWHVDLHMTPGGHARVAQSVEPEVEDGWKSGG
jgi:hypothetical protein